MVIAIIAALLVSVLGLVPFRIAIKKIRMVDPTMPMAMIGPFLLTIAASFLILIAGIVACKLLVADSLVVYSLTGLIAFTVGVVVMGVLSKRRL